MAHVATGSVVRQLGALFEGGSTAGLSDRQLLERYTASGGNPVGEAAFAALVGRHGPMVLGVCRQLLGDAQHAEDTFQAVFLVLAQKARSIRDPDLLGNWLYGVAIRSARCARQQIGRRRRREEVDTMRGPGAGSCAPAEPTAPPADRPAIDREQAEAIHGEVDRLPKAFRLPVVLCYFEGLTLDEAARRLRCPAGTLRSRLARAREKLRIGLTRRGVALPAAALGAVLAPRSASASIPPLLCDSTTRAAIAFAARHAATGGALSSPIVALAQEVLNTMLVLKLRLIAITVLALAAVVSGAGYLALALAGSREGEPDPKMARTEPRPPDEPRPPEGRMTVVGRVLDPEGKPVRGAIVDVVATPRVPITGAVEDFDPRTLLGRGESDGEGRYRLDAPRTASTRVVEVFALAAAPGRGLGLVELNPDADRPGADIPLRPEQPIRVRLVDVTGTPAKGVEIGIQGIGRLSDGLFEGVMFWTDPPAAMGSWPRPVKTDDQGRATVSGIGRGSRVSLTVRDPRYARQVIDIETGEPASDRETTHALEPAKLIEGRVLADDTGRPIPGAVIVVAASRDRFGTMFTTRSRADARGHYTVNPTPGDYLRVYAHAPEGQPYFVPQVEFAWTKGAVKKALDVRVPRGVWIRGKVTEAGTNRPLRGSSIQFIPVRGRDDVVYGWWATQASRDDGSFQVVVPPGRGHLLIFGPTGDYLLDAIGSRALFAGRPGGERYRAHAIIPYEVKAGDPPLEVAAGLRPGVTIKGRVEGPDGQTVSDAFILTTLQMDTYNPSWGGHCRVKVRDGRFELHGLDPGGTTRISILDPAHEWGTTVELSGQRADEAPTIRLQRCGRAKARFVGPDGLPVTKPPADYEFVATPGPHVAGRGKSRDPAALTADADFLVNIDRMHYWNFPPIDAAGRITLDALIPGAQYRISDYSTAGVPDKGYQVRRDFTVQAGETLDLGDILIEKPGE